jgi:hypothetical protein
MSLLTELGFVLAANYKDVAPTALEFLPSPSASPRFFQLPPRWDRNKVEAAKAELGCNVQYA